MRVRDLFNDNYTRWSIFVLFLVTGLFFWSDFEKENSEKKGLRIVIGNIHTVLALVLFYFYVTWFLSTRSPWAFVISSAVLHVLFRLRRYQRRK